MRRGEDRIWFQSGLHGIYINTLALLYDSAYMLVASAGPLLNGLWDESGKVALSRRALKSLPTLAALAEQRPLTLEMDGADFQISLLPPDPSFYNGVFAGFGPRDDVIAELYFCCTRASMYLARTACQAILEMNSVRQRGLDLAADNTFVDAVGRISKLLL